MGYRNEIQEDGYTIARMSDRFRAGPPADPRCDPRCAAERAAWEAAQAAESAASLAWCRLSRKDPARREAAAVMDAATAARCAAEAVLDHAVAAMLAVELATMAGDR